MTGRTEDELLAASAAQPGRLAAHREALMRSGDFDVAALAEVRDESEHDTRLWLAHQVANRRLLVVLHAGEQRVPAFQLLAGEPRAELAPLFEILLGAGVDGWTAWTWITGRSSLLSGEAPVHVALTDPARALRAARRFAWQEPAS